MGNPHEEDFFYRGFRDFGPGDPRTRDYVSDPTQECAPKPGSAEHAFVKEFMCQLREELKRTPIMAKRPAFVEPPYFSKPHIKVSSATIPAGGAAVAILDRKLGDRQRALITAAGVDVDPPGLFVNHQLLFWYATSGEVMPYFDDQSVAAAALADFQEGKTTIFPGSVEEPFNYMDKGVPVPFTGKGDRRMQLFVQNFGTEDAEICALVAFYEYWMTVSSAFEEGDNQV
jgi:hypothetical protein